MRRPIYAMILLDKAFSHSVKLRSEDIVRMPPKNSSWMSPHGSLYNAKGNTDFEVRGHPSFGICIGGVPGVRNYIFYLQEGVAYIDLSRTLPNM